MKKQDILIFTDVKNNNNKFYNITLEDDNNSINVKYGRVGSEGQTTSYTGGLKKYNSIINSKIAKGYVLSKIVSVDSKIISNKSKLKAVAKRDILGDIKEAKSLDLINKLIEINKHQILKISGGNIQVDDSGLIKTSLGLVNRETISDARKILNKLTKELKSFPDISKSINYPILLGDYLKLIPQKVPSLRGWDINFFVYTTTIDKQNDFLNQLESSMDLYDKKVKSEVDNNITNNKVFNFKLALLEDKKKFKEISDHFRNTLNSQHVSKNLKLKNIYVLTNEEHDKKFLTSKDKFGNMKQLWHGTRAFNILSILKNGLIVPKSSDGIKITGRMFGDGLYFSDQSTKALNYSYGYWDGRSKDNECFMFLANVALGKTYTPKKPGSYKPKDCDSIFAKAKVSGVLNNEMIVPNVEQVQLKYLCEFGR